jgi:transposase
MLYVGLDYHTKRTYVSILDDSGNEVFHDEMDSCCELAGFLGALPEEASVLFEAGYGWPRLIRELEGIDVGLSMCQPNRNSRIACDRRKSDRRDARNLAVYLKANGYKAAYIPDADIRDERQMIRGRTSLRCLNTGIRNRIHGLLAYAGVPKESGDIFTRKRRAYLESLELPESTRMVLDSMLDLLDNLNDLIKKIDAEIARKNRADPLARLLKTIPGVGDITAKVLLAEIGDIKRFATDKALACYTGLTPRQYQSGNTLRMMGLTKEGSAHMRWVLVQAAWVAVRLDPGLHEKFESLKKEKCDKIAICAVARKLAVAAWHILTKEVPYEGRKPEEPGKLVVPPGKPQPTVEVSP